MKTGIIVCAAGSGSRVGGETPKQFLYIGKKRVIDYTLDEILESEAFDDVVIMIRPGDEDEYTSYVTRGCVLAHGDVENGQETRLLGLNAFKTELGYEDTDLIAVADGNRPFISAQKYRELVDEAKEFGNVIPIDTQREIPIIYGKYYVRRFDYTRNFIRMTLAPCIFPLGILKESYEERGLSEGVVDVMMDRLKREKNLHWLHYKDCDMTFFKITTPSDVEFAKELIKGRE